MNDDHAVEIFRILGEPRRIAILTLVWRHPGLARSRLEQFLSVPATTVSHHVGVLHRAGLIDVHRKGREHFYSIRPDTLEELRDALRAVTGPAGDLARSLERHGRRVGPPLSAAERPSCA